MKRLWLALALALVAFPAMASADTPSAAAVPPGRPAMTPAQRQAMFKTFGEFRTKEMALHKQLRSQILGALSPAHRSAVAQVIGDLAVSASPDPGAAAKRIDGVLSSSEQQAILTAENSFRDQGRALMEQMRSQLASEMPSPGPKAPRAMHGMGGHNLMTADAGTLLLTILSHPNPMGMMGMHGFGMHGGPPPQDGAQPPPDISTRWEFLCSAAAFLMSRTSWDEYIM